MKILNKRKRNLHSSPSEDRKGLRRSLRLRLKASNTPLDVRSSRTLLNKKRNLFRVNNASMKISKRKLITNLTQDLQENQPKRRKIHSRGKDRNQRRASRKYKVRKEVNSDTLPEQKSSILTTQTRHSKAGKPAGAKSTKRKKTDRSKASKIGESKSKKSQGLQKTSKMKTVFLNSFSTERHDYTRQYVTRFCDVAFLDEKHIVALDDNWNTESFGHRICCFTLDGTLMCELPLPAHPWSVVVINPTEVVVSLRGIPSNGLIWVSVDISSRSLEIVRNIPLGIDCYGLAYNGDIFTVTHYKQEYFTLLNTNGEEIGRIPVSEGVHYRCLFLNDQASLLYLDHYSSGIRCINLDGRELFSLENDNCSSIALSEDKFGNIYVGNWVNGEIARFTKTGKFEGYLFNVSKVCGIAINKRSSLMAVAHEHCISLYKLFEEGNSE